jgi:hypothetical protein
MIGITLREFADGRFETFLSRLDPATLAAQGRRASVGEFHDTWSLSRDPDRHRRTRAGVGGAESARRTLRREAFR